MLYPKVSSGVLAAMFVANSGRWSWLESSSTDQTPQSSTSNSNESTQTK